MNGPRISIDGLRVRGGSRREAAALSRAVAAAVTEQMAHAAPPGTAPLPAAALEQTIAHAIAATIGESGDE
jgi:hypothetical protein